MKKADRKHLAGVFAVSPASWAPALYDPYTLPPVCVRGACPRVCVCPGARVGDSEQVSAGGGILVLFRRPEFHLYSCCTRNWS